MLADATTQRHRSSQPRRAHQTDECARVLGLDLALLLLAASQDGLLEQRLPLHRLARRRRAAAAARGCGREQLELAPQLRELRVLLAQLQLLRLRGATRLLPRLRLLLGGGLGLGLGLGFGLGFGFGFGFGLGFGFGFGFGFG